MKKLIVLALSALLAVSLCAIFVSAEETNVALGKTYTYTGALEANGKVQYPDDGNKELTDGVYGKVEGDVNYPAAMWVGMNQGGKDVVANSKTTEITVNLGKSVSGITKFTLNALHSGAEGIVAPAEVKVSVSADGSTYKDVGTMTSKKTVAKPGNDDKSKDNGIYDFTLSSAEQTAQYIKYTIKLNGAWAFISEVGAYTGAAANTSTPANNTSSEQAATSSAASSAAASSAVASSAASSAAASSAANSSKAASSAAASSAANSSKAASSTTASSESSEGLGTPAIIGIVAGAVVVIGVVVFLILKKKK
jgi:cobalamin biosynthesis Mg chelatase CobN